MSLRPAWDAGETASKIRWRATEEDTWICLPLHTHLLSHHSVRPSETQEETGRGKADKSVRGTKESSSRTQTLGKDQECWGRRHTFSYQQRERWVSFLPKDRLLTGLLTRVPGRCQQCLELHVEMWPDFWSSCRTTLLRRVWPFSLSVFLIVCLR